MISGIDELRQAYERLLERVETARVKAGSPEKIRIVPATKCVPPKIVALLPQIGVTEAGENRVQEFLSKCDLPLCWHFIGVLQTNKVKYLIGRTALIQSVDRKSLLDELEKRSERGGVTTDILLEVNGGGEESKSGVRLSEAEALLGYAETCAHICVRGMMCVLPKNASGVLYEKARTLYESLRESRPTFDTLSMGMSDDFETAIRCGATMIRPGQALFGAR